jgi:hypothetical protein
LPTRRAPRARLADAPPSPPLKKYQGTAAFQTGSLRIGRP